MKWFYWQSMFHGGLAPAMSDTEPERMHANKQRRIVGKRELKEGDLELTLHELAEKYPHDGPALP